MIKTGTILHYCTLHDRVKIETPSRNTILNPDFKPYKPIIKTCKNCQKQYETNGSKSHFCSHECKFEMLKQVCPVCNKEFLSKHQFNRSATCSRKCGTVLQFRSKKWAERQ